jgi:cobalamin biosynthesis protein CobD/CbiB
VENQPQQDQIGASQSDGNHASPDRGWRGVWGLLVLVFVLLLAACSYWLVTLGVGKAFENGAFLVLLILAILVLLCIGARMMVRMLRAGTVIDNRNFIDMSRSQRFRRH